MRMITDCNNIFKNDIFWVKEQEKHLKNEYNNLSMEISELRTDSIEKVDNWIT